MEHVSSVRPTGKFPEKVENLKRWAAGARLPGWNFRTEFRVLFSLYQFQVHGKKISHGQLANQNGFPQAHAMYQCTVCFFAGPTMEALSHHTSGLGLIGKYLVMSNSNIQRFIFTEKNRQAPRRTRVYDQNGTTFYQSEILLLLLPK